MHIMVSGSIQAPLHVPACPFCGLTQDAPHETQEACIEALHAEIARMRGILHHLHPLGSLMSAFNGPTDSGA